MNSRFTLLFRTLGALALAGLGCVAAVAAAEPATATVPAYNDEQKALVKALDSELGRFEGLIGKVDDATYAEFLRGELQGLKSRRDAFLKTAFDGGKYDELRYDLNVNIQRLAQWMMPPIAPPAPRK